MTKTHPNFGISSLAGPWFLPRARLDEIMHRARQVIRAGPSESNLSAVEDPGYSTVGAVAVISIIGIITKYPSWIDPYLGFTASENIQHAIANAMSDSSIRRIALLLDSAGGLVDGSNELANYVSRCNGEGPGQKPIHAVVSDTCCSAAYLVASQCRSIIANDFATIGSIGVYAVLTDDSKFWSDAGVTFTVVSTGPFKGLGADGKVTDPLVSEVQRGVDAAFNLFVAAVARGRHLSDAQVRAVADGRVWQTGEAIARRLIDLSLPKDVAIRGIMNLAAESGGQPNPTYRGQAPGNGAAMSGATKLIPPAGCQRDEATRFLRDVWSRMTGSQRSRWSSEDIFIVANRAHVMRGEGQDVMDEHAFVQAD